MKIGQKLIIGFLVVVVLTAILGIMNIVSIKNIGSETDTHHTLHVPTRFAVTHIRIDIDEIMRATEEYDADWMTKEESTEEIKEKKEDIENHLEQLFAAAAAAAAAADLPTPEEVDDLKGSINEIYDLSAELFLLHGKSREERTSTMEEFDEKVEEIDEKLDVMLGKVDKASEASLTSIRNTIVSSRKITISVLAVVLLAALGTAFAISRSIANPITKLKDAAIEIGEGKLLDFCSTPNDAKQRSQPPDLTMLSEQQAEFTPTLGPDVLAKLLHR